MRIRKRKGRSKKEEKGKKDKEKGCIRRRDERKVRWMKI